MATARKQAAKKAAAKKRPAAKAAPRRTVAAPAQAAEQSAGRRRIVVPSGDGVPEGPGHSYFADASQKDLEFISTGCSLLDAALGGGFAVGRTANIVGDKSTGKTLLAQEVSANFLNAHPRALSRYAESEAAFDVSYANALGMPTDRIIFNTDGKPISTVEAWEADLVAFLDKQERSKAPGLYVLDSLDALSDDAEKERGFGEGTYGGTKPKLIGQLFREHIDRLRELKVAMLVISQLRDKLGVTFGETKTRSGGKALDFYASQIIWLAEIEKIKRTVQGVQRVVGVKVKARIKKNKVGLPFREVEYPVLFGYGIDDLTAGVEWLLSIKRDDLVRRELDMSKDGYAMRIRKLIDSGGEEAQQVRAALRRIVLDEWARVETSFLPKSRKYGG